ncbi:hypothetical protein DMUE_3557 [Dictyocoela muelleri]|nr:hypothetical protein DMUE_3557 [Dictyocoela muelleri]
MKSYDDAFIFLKSKVTKHPKVIIIDFEQAAYLSFHQIFLSSNLKGCFFHLTQSIYRKVNQSLLSNKYKNDSEFRLDVKMIMSFAFLPEEELEKKSNSMKIT